jgi:hypothetical protein
LGSTVTVAPSIQDRDLVVAVAADQGPAAAVEEDPSAGEDLSSPTEPCPGGRDVQAGDREDRDRALGAVGDQGQLARRD